MQKVILWLAGLLLFCPVPTNTQEIPRGLLKAALERVKVDHPGKVFAVVVDEDFKSVTRREAWSHGVLANRDLAETEGLSFGTEREVIPCPTGMAPSCRLREGVTAAVSFGLARREANGAVVLVKVWQDYGLKGMPVRSRVYQARVVREGERWVVASMDLIRVS